MNFIVDPDMLADPDEDEFDPDDPFAACDIVDYYQSNPVLATQIAWSRMKSRGANPKEIHEGTFCFGDKFVPSLMDPRFRRRPHFHRDLERVFEAIVNVVGERWSFNSDKYHKLREHIKTLNSDRQTRRRIHPNGTIEIDKAARIEVAGGHTPIHLHLWVCSDGRFEFSNVTHGKNSHDDPTIYP